MRRGRGRDRLVRPHRRRSKMVRFQTAAPIMPTAPTSARMPQPARNQSKSLREARMRLTTNTTSRAKSAAASPSARYLSRRRHLPDGCRGAAGSTVVGVVTGSTASARTARRPRLLATLQKRAMMKAGYPKRRQAAGPGTTSNVGERRKKAAFYGEVLGADAGNRTPDPIITSAARHLSMRNTCDGKKVRFAGSLRFPALTLRRESNRRITDGATPTPHRSGVCAGGYNARGRLAKTLP